MLRGPGGYQRLVLPWDTRNAERVFILPVDGDYEITVAHPTALAQEAGIVPSIGLDSILTPGVDPDFTYLLAVSRLEAVTPMRVSGAIQTTLALTSVEQVLLEGPVGAIVAVPDLAVFVNEASGSVVVPAALIVDPAQPEVSSKRLFAIPSGGLLVTLEAAVVAGPATDTFEVRVDLVTPSDLVVPALGETASSSTIALGFGDLAVVRFEATRDQVLRVDLTGAPPIASVPRPWPAFEILGPDLEPVALPRPDVFWPQLTALRVPADGSYHAVVSDQRGSDAPPGPVPLLVSVTNQGFTAALTVPAVLPASTSTSADGFVEGLFGREDHSFFSIDDAAVAPGTVLDVLLRATTFEPDANTAFLDFVALRGPDVVYGRYLDPFGGYILPGGHLPLFPAGAPAEGRIVMRAGEPVTLAMTNDRGTGTSVDLEVSFSEVPPTAEVEPNDGTAQELGALTGDAIAVEADLQVTAGGTDVDIYRFEINEPTRPLAVLVTPEGAQDVSLELWDVQSQTVIAANDDRWELDRSAAIDLRDSFFGPNSLPGGIYELRITSPVPGDTGAYLLTIH